MYHIRRADNHDERSLHADTLQGLEAAVAEAIFRTRHQGHSHEIYDDVQDKVVHLVTAPALWSGPGQTDVQASDMFTEAPKEPAQERGLPVWFLLTAGLAAMFLFRWMHG